MNVVVARGPYRIASAAFLRCCGRVSRRGPMSSIPLPRVLHPRKTSLEVQRENFEKFQVSRPREACHIRHFLDWQSIMDDHYNHGSLTFFHGDNRMAKRCRVVPSAVAQSAIVNHKALHALNVLDVCDGDPRSSSGRFVELFSNWIQQFRELLIRRSLTFRWDGRTFSNNIPYVYFRFLLFFDWLLTRRWLRVNFLRGTIEYDLYTMELWINQS